MRKTIPGTIACLIAIWGWLWTASLGCAQEPEKQAPRDSQSLAGEVKYVPFPPELQKYEVYPWEMLKFPEFKKAYTTILGPNAKEKWIRTLNGPSSPSQFLSSPQGKLVQVYSCRPRDCGDHYIVVLFEPNVPRCWALLGEGSRTVWLGTPDLKMQQTLERAKRLIWPDSQEPKSK